MARNASQRDDGGSAVPHRPDQADARTQPARSLGRRRLPNAPPSSLPGGRHRCRPRGKPANLGVCGSREPGRPSSRVLLQPASAGACAIASAASDRTPCRQFADSGGPASGSRNAGEPASARHGKNERWSQPNPRGVRDAQARTRAQSCLLSAAMQAGQSTASQKPASIGSGGTRLSAQPSIPTQISKPMGSASPSPDASQTLPTNTEEVPPELAVPPGATGCRQPQTPRAAAIERSATADRSGEVSSGCRSPLCRDMSLRCPWFGSSTLPEGATVVNPAGPGLPSTACAAGSTRPSCPLILIWLGGSVALVMAGHPEALVSAMFAAAVLAVWALDALRRLARRRGSQRM